MSSLSPLHPFLFLSFQRSAEMLLFPHTFNTRMSGQLFLEFLYVSPAYGFSNLKVIEDFQWINELFYLHIYILVVLTNAENKQKTYKLHCPSAPLCTQVRLRCEKTLPQTLWLLTHVIEAKHFQKYFISQGNNILAPLT